MCADDARSTGIENLWHIQRYTNTPRNYLCLHTFCTLMNTDAHTHKRKKNSNKQIQCIYKLLLYRFVTPNFYEHFTRFKIQFKIGINKIFTVCKRTIEDNQYTSTMFALYFSFHFAWCSLLFSLNFVSTVKWSDFISKDDKKKYRNWPIQLFFFFFVLLVHMKSAQNKNCKKKLVSMIFGWISCYWSTLNKRIQNERRKDAEKMEIYTEKKIGV